MRILSGFLGFINKDVRGKNETKTIPVMLRVVSVIMMAYYVVFYAFISDESQWFMSVMAILGIALFLVGFILTYYEKTQITVIMTHAFVMLWTIGYVLFYGWECGVQELLSVLLLLGFVTSYSNYYVKCGYTVLLVLLRFALYNYHMNVASIYVLDEPTQYAFQLMNTLVVFATLACVIVIFVKNSMQMEDKLKTYNEQLIKLASIDPLTNLNNRRYTIDYLQNYIRTMKANDQLTIALGDIDFFKKFNDQYGHACGDEVLTQLSAVFQDFMEGQGFVARWGGEEFLIIFEGKNETDALIQMEKLLHRIRLMEVRYGGESLRVTMTFGIAQHDLKQSLDATISNADKKMYIGKQSGRNRIVIQL